jgi:hypothetical protein
MDAGFIKYTINFHSAKFMSFNVYQESSSPYQRPRHAQAKTEINLNIIRKKLWKPVFSSKNTFHLGPSNLDGSNTMDGSN